MSCKSRHTKTRNIKLHITGLPVSTGDLPTNIQMQEQHEKLEMGQKTARRLTSASSQVQILERKKDVWCVSCTNGKPNLIYRSSILPNHNKQQENSWHTASQGCHWVRRAVTLKNKRTTPTQPLLERNNTALYIHRVHSVTQCYYKATDTSHTQTEGKNWICALVTEPLPSITRCGSLSHGHLSSKTQ